MNEIDFTVFEVGAPFPIPFPPGMPEGAIPMVMDASIGLVNRLFHLRSREVQAFRKGRIRYGVFECYDVPFLVLDQEELGIVTASFNILAEKEGGKPYEVFLNEEANAIHMFLVEGTTGILKAMRLIGIDYGVFGSIKEACRRQLDRYSSAREIEGVIRSIEDALSVPDMEARTPMWTLGKEAQGYR